MPFFFRIKTFWLSGIFLAATVSLAGKGAAHAARFPRYKEEEVLVSSREKGPQNYLAFPAAVAGEGDNYWISYKRGYAHGRDDEALLEVVEWSPQRKALTGRTARLGEDDIVYQMGEWIRFPDGRLATFIDAQNTDERRRNYRVGIRWAELNEANAAFGEIRRLGLVDGIEYGYLFDSATIDGRVYALVMTFEKLPGGRRSVDVITTHDNGRTWSFVRNLSQEFGDIKINESSLIPRDDGFLVATRGYDARVRLHLVDRDFRLVRQADLTGQHAFIARHVGRPRLFEKGGRTYLVGRNYSSPESQMELALFRIDPEALQVTRYVVLDNRSQGQVRDGYYPFPLFVEKDGEEYLEIIDYKALFEEPPSIVRFRFRWRDVAVGD